MYLLHYPIDILLNFYITLSTYLLVPDSECYPWRSIYEDLCKFWPPEPAYPLVTTAYIFLYFSPRDYKVLLSASVRDGVEISYTVYTLTLNNNNTVKCSYNTVQHNVILHSSLQWVIQNINQLLDPQIHPIPRPNGQAMGCLLWGFWRKLTES